MRPHSRMASLLHRGLHGHAWLMGLLGAATGLAFLFYAPSMRAVASSLLLFAGFHLVGAIILLASVYTLGLGRLIARLRPATSPAKGRYAFGWGPEWMNGLALIALAIGWAAVAVAVVAPGWWPLAFVLLLLAANSLVGNGVMRSFRSADHVVLPMVDLLRGERDVVLDAGCGAGRTTIALSRVLRAGRVIAVDRFDADYIDGGGRDLIVRNLAAARIGDRVDIEVADLARLPIADGACDAAVSTNAFDHLGEAKPRALAEIFRVLKPGGRFLLAVWTPGWPMFAVANVFSFFLTSRSDWRAMAKRAGFSVVDEGVFNYAWFALLEKPSA
jgi:SAM-dependent methyltransferase